MTTIAELRKSFIKETKAPIPTIESPHFEYYLKLYDCDMQLQTKYDVFLDRFAVLPNMYRSTYYATLDSILENIKENSTSYANFIEQDMLMYERPYTPSKSKKKLYTSVNCNQKFISLDFSAANFHALLQFDPDFFNGFTTYEEWLCNIHKDGHLFKESKNFRQVLFGHLNTKRQQKIERYYLGLLMARIHVKYPLDNTEVIILSNDECIFPYSETLENAINLVLEEWAADATVVFKVRKEIFLLEPTVLPGGFVKKLSTGKNKFQCVPRNLFAQVYKSYYGIPLDIEKDLIFEHEGRICRYLDPLHT